MNKYIETAKFRTQRIAHAVYLCLIGKGLQRDSLLFMGWFGPRGLASIVFLVMVVAEKLPGNDTIVSVVVCTIVLSVVFHGLSANRLAALYGARAEARGQGKGWLTGFYVAWVFFDPVKLLVVFYAIADSWFNFRQRWPRKPGTDISANNEHHEKDKDQDH